MLDQFDAHFRRLLRRAREHADRVIVVRQPWFDGVYSPEEAAHMWHGGVGQAWRTDVTTYYSFDVVRKLMSLLDARAASIADAMSIEHIDLMPILEGNLANYYDCFHTTPAGAKVVAATVAAAVVRRRDPAPQAAEPLAAAGADRHASCVVSRAS
jgi:lysophospholipase L1-like esterase